MTTADLVLGVAAPGWAPGDRPPAFTPADVGALLAEADTPLYAVSRGGGPVGLAAGGGLAGGAPFTVHGLLGPVAPALLGDRSFLAAHGVRFPYVVGEMAAGIASVEVVRAAAEAGVLGIFGAAGLPPAAVDAAVTALAGSSGWGVNLIHSPMEPRLEEQVADLLIARGVPCVSASAYLRLTPAVVRCAAAGLRREPSGRVVRARRMLAKVSHPVVAEQFLGPPPREILDGLVAAGRLTAAEAALAAELPVVDDLTVEADSGGHTDRRPLTAILPVVLRLRDRLGAPVRVGAAGGLGTPEAVAAAFAAGAAYVLTGTVNSSCVEAALSPAAKELLCQAEVADVTMAPAADMFEMGATVQVLKRGTLFAPRAGQLLALYRGYPSLEALPDDVRTRLERDVLHATVAEVWALTEAFWRDRDPDQLARAAADPRHRMALVFRWYLGMASRWAAVGEPTRRADYQLWCGPAMGAFNSWAAGTALAAPAGRTVGGVARALLTGAALVARAQQARTYGVAVPPSAFAPGVTA